jgi:hypothetical protein
MAQETHPLGFATSWYDPEVRDLIAPGTTTTIDGFWTVAMRAMDVVLKYTSVQREECKAVLCAKLATVRSFLDSYNGAGVTEQAVLAIAWYSDERPRGTGLNQVVNGCCVPRFLIKTHLSTAPSRSSRLWGR